MRVPSRLSGSQGPPRRAPEKRSWLHPENRWCPFYMSGDNSVGGETRLGSRDLHGPLAGMWASEWISSLSGSCRFLKRKELMLGRERAKTGCFKRWSPDVHFFSSTAEEFWVFNRRLGGKIAPIPWQAWLLSILTTMWFTGARTPPLQRKKLKLRKLQEAS